MSGLMPFGPLAYQGTIAVPYIVRNFAPTTKDFNFNVPTVWIDPSNNFAWMLTSKPDNVADWLPFISGGGDISFLKGNTGGAVAPATNGIIEVVGDGTTVNVVGDPATHKLTISAVGSTAFTWQDATGTFTAEASKGYFATDVVTATMPAVASVGDTIAFCNVAGLTVIITANTGQKLQNGSTIGPTGNLTSTTSGDSIIFVYNDTQKGWFAIPGGNGNWAAS